MDLGGEVYDDDLEYEEYVNNTINDKVPAMLSEHAQLVQLDFSECAASEDGIEEALHGLQPLPATPRAAQ